MAKGDPQIVMDMSLTGDAKVWQDVDYYLANCNDHAYCFDKHHIEKCIRFLSAQAYPTRNLNWFGKLVHWLTFDGPWKQAVIDRLLVLHIFQEVHVKDPRKALADLLDYETILALDPSVSAAAAQLVTKGRVEGAIEAQVSNVSTEVLIKLQVLTEHLKQADKYIRENGHAHMELKKMCSTATQDLLNTLIK